MPQSDELLSPEQAAKQLHVGTQTLAVWRCHRRYPLAYAKIGSKVLYRQSEIDRFIESRTITSEPVESSTRRQR